MSGDYSRFAFDPTLDYQGVRLQQGRPLTDRDWNDATAQANRRQQTDSLDTLGPAVVPLTTPDAFAITIVNNDFTLGRGRMYVDGLVAENHGTGATAWDPVLEELQGTTLWSYLQQPYLPNPPALPAAGPLNLVYLDVWQREVTCIEDGGLVDSAIGVDTTTRIQTVWQVKLLANIGNAVDCSTPLGNITGWSALTAPSAGQLTTATGGPASTDPCQIAPSGNYKGLENQLYRVEIHDGGDQAHATFKWSRNNASVVSKVVKLIDQRTLVVDSIGKDGLLRFSDGDWVEITDDWHEFGNTAGEIHQIVVGKGVDDATRTIKLTSDLGSTFGNATVQARNTRIKLWDQGGKVLRADGSVAIDLDQAGGVIPVPASGSQIVLESGILVSFDLATAGGQFKPGDYWTFCARAADASIELLDKAPPRGIHHHYAKLGLTTLSGKPQDCRLFWPPAQNAPTPAGTCGCCTVTVGDGVESIGQYTSINAALASLPDTGGEVCILPGRYFEHVRVYGMRDVVIRGCGYQTRLASPSLAPPAAGGPPAPAPPPPAVPAAQTMTASSPVAAPAKAFTLQRRFEAVIAMRDSEHIQLRSFAVEAEDGEVGILLDGTDQLTTIPIDPIPFPSARKATAPGNTVDTGLTTEKSRRGILDVLVKEVTLTASTLPALLANRVRLLHFDDNRVATKNVRSLWPAVYVSGQELHIERNRVGIQGPAVNLEWLGANVQSDLVSYIQVEAANATSAAAAGTTAAPAQAGAAPKAAATATANGAAAAQTVQSEPMMQINRGGFTVAVAEHPGGIQVAGPADEVFIIDNLIDGGRFNGITLGSYTVTDDNGNDTGSVVGLGVTPEDPCCTNGTLQTPSSPDPGAHLVAGEMLRNISIERNRIGNMGLCGIGPVGFFDLLQSAEVIAIENLSIIHNSIEDTVRRRTTPVNPFGNVTAGSSSGSAAGGTLQTTISHSEVNRASAIPQQFAFDPYAAVCLPSVSNLSLRDNDITNFGFRPGDNGNGIFLMHGEAVEISRNRVVETRDWNSKDASEGGSQNMSVGGIALVMVTPPVLNGAAVQNNPDTDPLFEPGLPALRVEGNQVRIPVGIAFMAVGLGPFSIADNHFAAGGPARPVDDTSTQTVDILNFGGTMDWEFFRTIASITTAIQNSPVTFQSVKSGTVAQRLRFTPPSNGPVSFTDNVCMLEAGDQSQMSLSSVSIFTFDSLVFTGNQCWIDSDGASFWLDALMAGGNGVVATSNRLQEPGGGAYLSGLSVGGPNITSLNICDSCLLAVSSTKQLVFQSNIEMDQSNCSDYKRYVGADKGA